MKVFRILTCIRQENANERYRNTVKVKDLLSPNTVSQKHKKLHATGLDDTAIPHIKIKITDIPFEKNAQYSKPPCPPLVLFGNLWINNYSQIDWPLTQQTRLSWSVF